MSEVTLAAVKAKQSELTEMIQKLEQASLTIKIEGRTIELQPGERYAGARLDPQGRHLHHVIVMAARPSKKLEWKEALTWGSQAGGAVGSPEEYALVKANCPDLLTESWYWTGKEYEGDASYAWTFFSLGYTSDDRKSAAGGALAFRRV